MPDSAQPPTDADLDERVRALEEYVSANPPAARPTSASSAHVGYTGGIVIEFPHTHVHLSYPQIVSIVAGAITMVDRPHESENPSISLRSAVAFPNALNPYTYEKLRSSAGAYR